MVEKGKADNIKPRRMKMAGFCKAEWQTIVLFAFLFIIATTAVATKQDKMVSTSFLNLKRLIFVFYFIGLLMTKCMSNP